MSEGATHKPDSKRKLWRTTRRKTRAVGEEGQEKALHKKPVRLSIFGEMLVIILTTQRLAYWAHEDYYSTFFRVHLPVAHKLNIDKNLEERHWRGEGSALFPFFYCDASSSSAKHRNTITAGRNGRDDPTPPFLPYTTFPSFQNPTTQMSLETDSTVQIISSIPFPEKDPRPQTGQIYISYVTSPASFSFQQPSSAYLWPYPD
jgi:hypothetical protein